jgi:magnesium chelatase subunit D
MAALADSPPRRDAEMRWANACEAAALFAIDPAGLGGVLLHGAPGPVRNIWLEGLRSCLPAAAAWRRLPAGIGDDRLLGGLDLTATLSAGQPVVQQGLLADADGGLVIAPMAERLSPGGAARIAAAMDSGEVRLARDGMSSRFSARFGIVLLDEGIGDDETAPAIVTERCAFRIDLDGLPWRNGSFDQNGDALDAARSRLPFVEPAPEGILEALASTAAAYGIGGIMAPLLALRAARASAALSGSTTIGERDAVTAVRLVLAPRAVSIPPEDQLHPDDNSSDVQGEQKQGNEPGGPENDADQKLDQKILEDILLAAVQAALPDGLIAKARITPRRSGPAGQGRGAGAPQLSLLRGRPKGARSGELKAGTRLALVDTLRAAAPWQSLRRQQGDTSTRVAIRPADVRIKTFLQRRESTLVFCVDASGSAAFARLAEAKGAVELLLGEAYATRTYAALIAFRGVGADLILPPTRSVSRARALLAELPGGGGTPLASGLDEALKVALAERARGRDPQIVLLTDGRANIARDGIATRGRATSDAAEAAQAIAIQGVPVVFIDTAPRPRGESSDLATRLGAHYVALPYLEATTVRDAVRASLAG